MAAEALALLREAGALLEGHFQLRSGKHSPVYVEKFRALERPQYAEKLCRLIAERFRDENIEVVAGPTTGGIIVSYEVSRQLGQLNQRGQVVVSVFAEKEETGERRFRRGFDVRGRRVLVVDDVLTAGGSVGEVIAAVREGGGEVAGVGVLVDRGGGKVDLGVPFFACLTLDLPAYEASDCPQCARREPLTVT